MYLSWDRGRIFFLEKRVSPVSIYERNDSIQSSSERVRRRARHKILKDRQLKLQKDHSPRQPHCEERQKLINFLHDPAALTPSLLSVAQPAPKVLPKRSSAVLCIFFSRSCLSTFFIRGEKKKLQEAELQSKGASSFATTSSRRDRGRI